LHKDFLTSYRMAFDYQRYKVLGPLTALESERFLDRDSRLTKEYEGPNLVLYKLKPENTLGARVRGQNAATLAIRLRGHDAADCGRWPHGGEAGSAAPVPREPDDSERRAGSGALRRDPEASDERRGSPGERGDTGALPRADCFVGQRFAMLGPDYVRARKPSAFVYAPPHGDWLTGNTAASAEPRRPFYADRPEPARSDGRRPRRTRSVRSRRALVRRRHEPGVADLPRTATSRSPTDSLPKGCRRRPCARALPSRSRGPSSGRAGASRTASRCTPTRRHPSSAVAGSELPAPLPLTADPQRHAGVLARRHDGHHRVAAHRDAPFGRAHDLSRPRARRDGASRRLGRYATRRRQRSINSSTRRSSCIRRIPPGLRRNRSSTPSRLNRMRSPRRAHLRQAARGSTCARNPGSYGLRLALRCGSSCPGRRGAPTSIAA